MQTYVRHKRWYAIQPFYRRYAEIHAVLDDLDIGYVHPYRFNVVRRDAADGGGKAAGGIYALELDPVMVVQLIFFYADNIEVEEVRKRTFDQGRVLPKLGTTLWNPLEVPGAQLLEFLKVLSIDGDYELVDDRPEAFSKGETVRVIAGGQYDGLEGVVCRIKKNRHLIVRVAGVCAVATGYIPQAHLAKASAQPGRRAQLPCMQVAELAYNLRLLAALGRDNDYDRALGREIHALLAGVRQLMQASAQIGTRLDLTDAQVERLAKRFERCGGDAPDSFCPLPDECLRTRELIDDIGRHLN